MLTFILGGICGVVLVCIAVIIVTLIIAKKEKV